jgi:hypothetical protein
VTCIQSHRLGDDCSNDLQTVISFAWRARNAQGSSAEFCPVFHAR